MNMTKRIVDTILVSFTKVEDKNNPDNGLLVIGRKRLNESVEAINAFEGKEANDIYKKLIAEAKVKN